MDSKSVYIINNQKRNRDTIIGVLLFFAGVGISTLGLCKSSNMFTKPCDEQYLGEFIEWAPESENKEVEEDDGN